MLERLSVNWPLKLLSLGLAFVVWLWVTGEDRIVQDFQVPLEVRLGAERTLAENPPTTVTVRLRGPESLLRKLDALRLGVVLDLGDAPIGPRDVELARDHLTGVPRLVEVAFIDPARVALRIEPRLRREVPVEVRWVGKPAAGYAVYHSEVRPESLLVEGPESEVLALGALRTNPVSLEQRTASVRQSVGAVPARAEVRLVDPRPIQVRAVIDTAPIERTFDAVPLAGTGASGERLSAARVRVTLRGPAALLDRVPAAGIRARAAAVTRGQTLAVEVDLVDIPPADLERLEVADWSPREVRRVTGEDE